MTNTDRGVAGPAVLLFIALTALPLSAEVVALWDFDYDTVDDAWADNYGTIQGTPYFAAGRPGAGRALELTGHERVEIAHEWNFDISEALTVAAWIQVRSFNRPWQAIITKGNSAWRIQRNSATNTVEFACSGLSIPHGTRWGNLFGTRNVNDGQWHHIAGVYDGKQMYLYVDGTLDVSQDASGRIGRNDRPVFLGDNCEESERYFKGLLDDVVICNHALDANGVRELYHRGPTALLPVTRMDQLVAQAEQALTTPSGADVLETLGAKISAHELWLRDGKDKPTYRDRFLSPDLYFLLARTREAARRPAPEIAAACVQAVQRVPYRTRHVADALVWLSGHLPPDEYGRVVREFAGHSLVLSYDVQHTAQRFREAGDWSACERFLNALFAATDFRNQPTCACLPAVRAALADDESWAQKLSEYCRSRRDFTRLLFQPQEKLAQEWIDRGDYLKAAEVYRDIVAQCRPEQDRAFYDYQACECTFRANRFDNAVQALNAFLRRYHSDDPRHISRALMLKGRCHINRGAIDEAVDAFLDLVVTYPRSDLAAEASFLMGYCLMLQGKFEDAGEALHLVVREHPASEYAGRARQYLERINTMTR
jgi:tetratricopeptide (TPR) repeat protein